jgi:hypothetical protein
MAPPYFRPINGMIPYSATHAQMAYRLLLTLVFVLKRLTRHFIKTKVHIGSLVRFPTPTDSRETGLN